jgi:hypothetical protein
MSKQVTDTILMIRPVAFGFNRETAESNTFQHWSNSPAQSIQDMAEAEFDSVVDTLMEHGIHVLVVEDKPEPPKPDAVFINNWICTMNNGVISLFPLFAANRRLEKRDDIPIALSKKFNVSDYLDWSEYEAEGFFLEGTGSMVMDHDNRIIYAGLSVRTHKILLEKFARYHQYRVMWFTARDEANRLIFHTNLMMSIGEKFAVVCESAIKDEFERVAVIQLLSTTGHQVIPISSEQMKCYAGNLIELKNNKGKHFITIGKQALDSLTREQVKKLSSYATLLPVNISTIEQVGGGGIRSMIVEVFLQPNK